MTTFTQELERLIADATTAFAGVNDSQAVRDVEVQFLGRKGRYTALAKSILDIPVNQKAEAGRLLNDTKKQLEKLLDAAKARTGSAGEHAAAPFDVTMPGTRPARGRLHPVTQMLHRVWDVFAGMGYELVDGPEIETDEYNFRRLNLPPDHPARDMQDTFYLTPSSSLPRQARDRLLEKGEGRTTPNPSFEKEGGDPSQPPLGKGRGSGAKLLRTQTTSVTLGRELSHRKPPFQLLATGKCYRRDEDQTHTPMFHQFDGVVVGDRITFGDLRGTLQVAMRRILEMHDLTVRFRISYFPFVEPGAEFDVTYRGKDGSQHWLEMGGCGMIHPDVLRMAGHDPERVTGFAFGFGVERPFMIKHGVPDLRLFFQNDLRFLTQF